VTACGVRIGAILAVLGAGRQLMGQPLGGHPYIVYRTEGLSASVGGDCVAGISCHQRMSYCRAVMAGLRLLVGRGRRNFYRVSVARDVARVSQRLARPARRRGGRVTSVSARVRSSTLGRFVGG
jgi:hypothetical protein